MKLKQLLENLNKLTDNKNPVDFYEIAEELGNYDFSTSVSQDDSKLTAYWVAKSYCTDSYVGILAYFLEDEFVFLTQQLGRKSDVSFYWASEKTYHQVLDYINQIDETRPDDLNALTMVDYDQEMDIGFRISYGSELLTNRVYYVPGKCMATVMDSWSDMNDIKRWSLVKLQLEDGSEIEANLKTDVLIPYELTALSEEVGH